MENSKVRSEKYKMQEICKSMIFYQVLHDIDIKYVKIFTRILIFYYFCSAFVKASSKQSL